MNKLYVFSGLGVDQRVFSRINFSNRNVVFVPWIPPLPNESLSAYAKRISIPFKDENPILIGVSFGGMICSEIAKIIPVQKVLLISSIQNPNQLPLLYKIVGKLRLDQLVPAFVFQYVTFLNYFFFGISSSQDKKLLKEIMNDTDPNFLKWAIGSILRWNTSNISVPVVTIHGSNDLVLPIIKFVPNIKIQNGGHFMIVSHSDEVQKALDYFLGN